MESKYEILNRIKLIEKKHLQIKNKILEKIDIVEKTQKELDKLETQLKGSEEEYISLIEKFVEINE